jgi:hypothetical protein
MQNISVLNKMRITKCAILKKRGLREERLFKLTNLTKPN